MADTDNHTRLVPLANGLTAKVDAADFDLVSRHWWAVSMNRGRTYAQTKVDGRRVGMHRLILGDPAGMHVDHVDGDGLNNCRSNLRACTQQQNNANRRHSPLSSSPYKGVWFEGDRWRAAVQVNGKRRKLGSFGSAEAAARAYDAAAVEAFGEFAATNTSLGLLT